jgi:dolichol-phosphate mannosyltransferase
MASKASSASAKAISVVVPTYEEAANLEPLCKRLFKACKAAGIDAELLFVDDDSGKGTQDSQKIVADLQKQGYAVKIRVRQRAEGSGLSSAVILGIRESTRPVVLCMDADLQHEPESVPAVAEPVLSGRAEFAVGSRHVQGGGATDFPLVRRIISWGATLLALPLTSCTDPMSGFFCISREAFERGNATLNPVGYKIGLELMVRCQCARAVVDVPITFRDREAGESKLTMKQNILYVQHLSKLYRSAFPKTLVALAVLAMALLAGLLLWFFPELQQHLPKY